MKPQWPQKFLRCTLAGMELCWFGAVLDLVWRKVAVDNASWLILLAFYPLSFGLVRIFRFLGTWKKFCLMSMAWLLAFLFYAKYQYFRIHGLWDLLWLESLTREVLQGFQAFNPEMLSLMSSAVLWAFGWRLGTAQIRFAVVLGEFQFGLTILFITFFARSQLGMDSGVMLALTLVFFPLALGGISLSHAAEQESWLAVPPRSRWTGLLLLSIGTIFIFGLLVNLLLTPSSIQWLFSLLAAGGQWILGILEKFFLFLIGLFPPSQPGNLPSPAQSGQLKKISEPPFILFSDSTREVIRFLWAIMCISLVVVALWRVSSQILEWLRRRLTDTEEAETESLPGAFREDLLKFLAKIFQALRMKWPFRKKKPGPGTKEGDFARSIYRQILAWAEAGGHGRKRSETPLEYLETLWECLPENREDLTLITDRYVRARYGPALPRETDGEPLKESWLRVRQNHSRLRKRKPRKP